MRRPEQVGDGARLPRPLLTVASSVLFLDERLRAAGRPGVLLVLDELWALWLWQQFSSACAKLWDSPLLIHRRFPVLGLSGTFLPWQASALACGRALSLARGSTRHGTSLPRAPRHDASLGPAAASPRGRLATRLVPPPLIPVSSPLAVSSPPPRPSRLTIRGSHPRAQLKRLPGLTAIDPRLVSFKSTRPTNLRLSIESDGYALVPLLAAIGAPEDASTWPGVAEAWERVVEARARKARAGEEVNVEAEEEGGDAAAAGADAAAAAGG